MGIDHLFLALRRQEAVEALGESYIEGRDLTPNPSLYEAHWWIVVFTSRKPDAKQWMTRCEAGEALGDYDVANGFVLAWHAPSGTHYLMRNHVQEKLDGNRAPEV